MRDIKFRAWEQSQKKFYYFNIIGHNLICKENPIMQYTGLKDKNGKEIYEADILRSSLFQGGKPNGHHYTTVKWSNGNAGFGAVNGKNVEIIGNIYENPELLNTKPEGC